MLSKYRSLALCAFFVLPALLLSACGGDVPGNSVAKVGDQSIRRSTFDHWMQIAAVSAAGPDRDDRRTAPKAQVPDAPSFTKCIAQKKATAAKPAKGQPEPTEAQLKDQCQQEYNQLRDQVLEFLIRGNWIEQETKKQDVKVSDKDVQKQIDAAVKQAFQNPGDFQKFLQRSGLTQADVFYQQRNQLLQQKLTEKVTKAQGTVTDAQIQQYYDKNKSKFSTPERRDLRIVLTKTQAKAAQARKALESGQSWADVDEEVLDRPGLEGAGRQARRRREGPAGEGARRRDLQGRQGQARRPGQDPVRLLHPRGLEDRAGQAAVARAVEGVDQADPHERQPAQGARHVRQGLPQPVEGRDGLPQGLHDGRLQERPEDAADHVDRCRAAADGHRRTTTQP